MLVTHRIASLNIPVSSTSQSAKKKPAAKPSITPATRQTSREIDLGMLTQRMDIRTYRFWLSNLSNSSKDINSVSTSRG
jgi:hypothetical protein